MKLAFIQAPAWGRDCPPYTMCFLAALVRQKGHQAFIFDINNALYHTSSQELRKMWDDKDYYVYWENPELVNSLIEANKKIVDFYVEKILKTDVKIIGFTVHFSSAWASLEIARRIKEQDKRRIVVFGGPDCSRQMKGDYFIKQDCVDIVVHGEGEGPLFEIIDRIDNLENIESLEGCLLLRNGIIKDGGYMPGHEDLDNLPISDYSDFKDDINLRMYREPHRLDIFDSRGCPMHCHFCSEWQFWGKFRSKSGKKIYEEIIQHTQDFPQVNYFYFAGSLVNGDMRTLEKFCDLVIVNKLKIQWAGQAIIRPEMSKELLEKMKKAGCEWLGYGIESGSQKVVDSMNKHFSIINAEEVLRDTHRAGISTQVNFMFGIPTEAEDDFRQTLEFLKRNRENIDSVLASQSFCVIDKGTYIYTNAGKFGIRNVDHHIYWEANGNNYAQRFRRYEEFCQLALSLGLPETSGVLRVKPDKWLLLGEYYLYKKDYFQAMECFKKSLKLELWDGALLQKINLCQRELERLGKEILRYEISSDALERTQNKEAVTLAQISLKKEVRISCEELNETQKKVMHALTRLGLEEKLKNYQLIEYEKQSRQECVSGFPYWLTIDPTNFCTLKCPFCPTGQARGSRTKGMLSFENFKKIMDELGPYLLHIDFCNWGEPLLNKEIYEMIKYVKQYNVDTKVDSNFNCFSEKDAEDMVLSGLDKLIVSIDGATQETYSRYRIGGDFNKVINNLKILIKKKKELAKFNPYICWQFLVFRHNEHEIEEVKKIGRDLGIDNVGITKAFIGNKDWIPLNDEYSHYRREEIKDDYTSEHFKSPEKKFCNWPWEAIVLNPNGSVSPCCSVEDEKGDFGNISRQSFMEIWNNETYRVARRYIKDTKVIQSRYSNVCIDCQHLGLINLDILACRSLFDVR